MLHVTIANGADIAVDLVDGYPAVLDDLAGRAIGERAFLRAAWYRAAAPDEGSTILATRGDGRALAAIPTAAFGPPLLGARAVPGSYWPFRSILIDAEATQDELAALFAAPQTRAALAPMWRVGPVYRSDPATAMLKRAAARAGWTVLTRTLGRTFLFDLAAMSADRAWPRKSTRRRLANYEKQLGQAGAVRFRFVTGDGWDEAVFDTLAAVEANSWVGKKTDGSGAKFLTEAQRGLWHRATRDPAIAGALSATILFAGDTPAAFSFDLRAGAMQYSIASSYDDRFAACRPGKIVTYRQLEWARARGVATVDLGAGDSGYKREMGAVAGSEIVDLLIVRSRSAAQLLRFKWGAESELGRDVFLATMDERGGSRSLIEPLLAAGAIAAATLALTE